MGDQIDRRSFLARGVASGAGLAAAGTGLGGLLSACGSSSGGSSSGGRKPGNGISSATPKKGGSLVFGCESEQDSFDPAAGRFDESGVMYARTVFDPLTMIAFDGTVKPYLAQSVTPNADYSVWTIGLRPNVQFHDGTPCDAAAVAGSMQHFMNGELGLVTTQAISKVAVTDPMTETVTLKQPWVPFPFLLSGGIGGQIGYVAAPSMIANKNGGMQPVGTGPFKFGEWVQNSHFTANRNPNYWRSGYPYLDSIKYTPIADSAGRAQALAAGTVDMIHTDLAETTLQYQNQSGFGFVDDLNGVVGEPDMDLLLLNLSAAPFNDIRVRQAVAMCLNLEEYKTVENKGLNPVSTGPFVAGSPYYNANSGYPAYNPTQAKALVQQVMRDNGGKPVTFEFGSSTSSNAVKAAQILQANMQTVGMQVTLAQVEQNALISNALAGKFQCYEWRQFAAVDPDLNYPFWSPTTDFAGLGISADMTRNTDPKIETLLQQGRTSVDPQTRAQAYQNLQAQFAQDLPYIWYDRAVWSVIAQGKVQNFNNPTTPEGDKGFGMIVGTVWPTQIWLQS